MDRVSSSIPWIDDGEVSTISTIEPDLIAEETTIGTLAVIIVVAVFLIFMLFGIAIFIDCRQQKITKDSSGNKSRLTSCFRMPVFIRNMGEDVDVVSNSSAEPNV